MRSREDTQALQQALHAVDASLSTLTLARQHLVDRLEETGRPAYVDPTPTMGQVEPVIEECKHLNTVERTTMNQTWFLCEDCKEMVDPDDVE